MPVMSENRIKSFKNKGKDTEELRRRRTDVTVELRKAKRDDQMLKRRNVASFTSVSPLKESNQSQGSVQLLSHEEIVKILTGDLSKQSDNLLLSAVQSVRKMLSKERNPPINSVIKANLVPKIVELLWKSTSPIVQFEAAWAVTNVASGTSDQTKHVVDSGAVPIFVKLLSSPEPNVAEQAVWALGNIAGDGAELRDRVLKEGILIPLLNLINPNTSSSFLRNVTWTLSNLCRNKNPPPRMEEVRPALPLLAQLIYHPDKEVVADACWAISYLTDGANDRIEIVIATTGVVDRLVELLSVDEVSVLTPSLRAVGNMVTGTDEHTQKVVDKGALLHIARLLRHPKISIVKEATWAVSNITAGNQAQIQAVIEAQTVPAILEILAKGDYKSQKEAIWVVTNFTSGGHPQQVQYLIDSGVVPPLCGLLAVKDPKVIVVILDGINNILLNAQRLERLESVCVSIEECGGLDRLELLQEHLNEQIHKMAYDIIDNFFSDEPDTDTGLEPEVTDEMGTFSFSAPSQVPCQGFTL